MSLIAGKVEDTSSARFRELVDRLRSRGLVSEQVIRSYLLAVSTFVLLRNADLEEAERQAIAEFDLSEYLPQLPHDLSWGTISCIDPLVLHSSLELKVWPALLTLQPSDLGSPLHRIPAAVDLKAIPEEVLVAARTSVAETWTNTAGRDLLASEFEQILRSWVEQTRFSGEFATPPALADLMVELAAPRVGDRVYDPCFGTGGLLVRAARRIVHDGMSLSSQDWNQLQSQSIFGIDIQPHLSLIATARLVLAGMSFPKLEAGNSLERNGIGDHGNEGFDCILANPPFGIRVNEATASRFRVRSTSGDVLFLQHILRSLRQGGRAVVAVPEGVLFRSGAEAKLREILLKECRVEAVLSLPPNSLAPYSSVKTSLLLFSRQSPRRTVSFVGQDVLATLLTGDGAPELRRELVKTIASRELEQPTLYANKLHEVGAEVDEMIVAFGGPTVEGTLATLTLHSIERLAQRNWELVVKDTGDAALDVFLERAVESRPDSRVCKLGELADVFRGIQYNKASFVESETASDVNGRIAFVRVHDVTRASRSRSDHTRLPEVRRPTAYLTEEAAHELEPHRRLQVGDVLISASGTVGNVAIVGEGIAGAVPAQSVFVIRITGNVQAPVLVRLLQSETYQSWLQGHSSGRTIRHLSIRALRELPLLVLDEVVQRTVARELAGGASDDRILQVLSRATGQSYWLTLIQNDPVLGLLERSMEANDLNAWGLLADWLGPSPSWEADATRDAEHDPFANWLLTWTQAARALRQAREIPHPMSRFAALQGWKSELIAASPSKLDPTGSSKSLQGRAARLGALGAMAALAPLLGVAGVAAAGVASLLAHRIDRSLPQGTSAAQRRAQRLTALLLTLADSEIKSLLERVQLDITAEPSIVPVGSDSEIEFRLKNIGPLAVGAVSVRTAPVHSEAELLFLDVGQELSWAMPLQPSEPGQLSIDVAWSATRLDDSRVSGHSEVSLSIVSRSSLTPVLRPLETSPYVTGNPIGAERPEMFFGRDEILARIRRSLRQEGPGTVLILEGVRRSGKTSILKQLVDVQPPHGWIPVYWSSQSGDGKQRVEGIPSGSLFYTIARECILAAHAKGVTFKVPKVGAVPPSCHGSTWRSLCTST